MTWTSQLSWENIWGYINNCKIRGEEDLLLLTYSYMPIGIVVHRKSIYEHLVCDNNASVLCDARKGLSSEAPEKRSQRGWRNRCKQSKGTSRRPRRQRRALAPARVHLAGKETRVVCAWKTLEWTSSILFAVSANKRSAMIAALIAPRINKDMIRFVQCWPSFFPRGPCFHLALYYWQYKTRANSPSARVTYHNQAPISQRPHLAQKCRSHYVTWPHSFFRFIGDLLANI
jgi:hypothetical protein